MKKLALIMFVVLVFILQLAVLDAMTADVAWDPNTDAVVGYVIYWQEAADPAAEQFNARIAGIDTTTYTIPEVNLKPNVEYDIWLKSYDAEDYLSESSEVIQYTRIVNKVPPDNLPTEEHPVDTSAPPTGLGRT